ncbi:hypothetical protein BSKO_06524 [Bryopsis sp. KO-2023]|nr:hypothetical protein BSKO_06524 [Bryopsis sp. KO-2023]
MHSSLLSASPPIVRTGRANARVVPRGVGSASGNSSIDDSYCRGRDAERRASFDVGTGNNSVPFEPSSWFSSSTDRVSTSQGSSNQTVTGFDNPEKNLSTFCPNLLHESVPHDKSGASKRGLLSLELTGNGDLGKVPALISAQRGFAIRGPIEESTDWDLSVLQKQSKVWRSPSVVLAYTVASEAHAGQFRKNGDPVLAHCVETAKILAELNADEVTVSAALLHDVIDDTEWTLEKLASRVSPDVCQLVKKVSKISYISQLVRNHRVAAQTDKSSKLRDMLMAATDCRAVLVKLADRVHNLRTISALPFMKQVRIAEETMAVFVPLAGRLGCWTLKSELEDLSFRIELPQEYKNLKAQYDEFISDRESSHLNQALTELRAALDKEGIQYEDLSGRPKNLFGVYKKMRKRRCSSLTDVLDLLALRVVVPDKVSCYLVLRKVHELWKPIEGRFKDYIRKPKQNGYQSIHDVVATEDGVPFEVQIRTAKMHYIAEHGVAAHWRYKEDDSEGVNQFVEARIIWSRYILSYLLELNDKKCRPENVDDDTEEVEKLAQVFCAFPERESNYKECRHHASHFPRPVMETDFWGAPVYVALRTTDGLEVCEVSQNCTIESFLLDHSEEEGVPSGMPMINGELAHPDRVVSFGDLIEFSKELSKGGDQEGAAGKAEMDMYCLTSPSPILVNASSTQAVKSGCTTHPDVMGEGLLKAFVPGG